MYNNIFIFNKISKAFAHLLVRQENTGAVLTYIPTAFVNRVISL